MNGTLILVGSYKPETRAQVERLLDGGTLVLTVPREAILNQDETYLMGIRSGAAAALKQGRHVAVRSENWPEAVEVTKRLAAKRWIAPEEIERRVLYSLARIGESVIAAVDTPRLIVAGTDTAEALCRQAGIATTAPVGEVAPGLTVLRAAEPRPLLLVRKPGGTGEPDGLVQAVAGLAAIPVLGDPASKEM